MPLSPGAKPRSVPICIDIFRYLYQRLYRSTSAFVDICIDSHAHWHPKLIPHPLLQDVVRAVRAAGASARVGDYMTSPAFTVMGRAHVAEAAGVMLAGKVHRLPVVDKDG